MKDEKLKLESFYRRNFAEGGGNIHPKIVLKDNRCLENDLPL